MSAAVPQPEVHDDGAEVDRTSDDATAWAQPVVVRRNAGLAALVGALASAIAIAYLWRATTTSAALDWALCLVMAAIAATHLANFLDARTPLLVADHLGVRIRLGHQWRGLPWDGVLRVEVRPRRGLLRDGRLVFAPHNLDRALDGLEPRGRRAAALNQKVYGAAFAVPMSLTTRVSAPVDLAEALSCLVQGRAEVVDGSLTTERGADGPEPSAPAGPSELPGATAGPTDAPTHGPIERPVEAAPVVSPVASAADGPEVTPDPAGHLPRRRLVGGLGTLVSRAAKGRSHDLDAEGPPADVPADPAADPGADTEPTVPVAVAAREAVPLRETRRALRAEVTRDAPATVLGNAVLLPERDERARGTSFPESRELRRPGSVDLEFEVPPAGPADRGRVRAISSLGDPVEPLVIDDFATEPAADPVIGPELAAARTRLGLSVDQLADRTRIRPHVIESIEVDDFVPCGGDFYARGHLRTLARVLGQDPAPLLERFDNRYATAPINARRVFEAELATGMTGSMRSTVGGPNWALLVGVVLVLVMVWGVVRLLASDPTELLEPAAPPLNGSAGVHSGPAGSPGAPAAAPRPIRVTLVGAQDGSKVVVRNRAGKVVWAGKIVLGEKRTVTAVPPVTVKAADAGALVARVNGKDRGPLGTAGEPGRRTFHRPASR